MNKTLLAAITGKGEYAVKPTRPNWYHLTRKGDRFPIAGGDMKHMMQTFAKL